MKISELVARLERLKLAAGDIECVTGSHLAAIAAVTVSSGFDQPPVAIFETQSSLRLSAGYEPKEAK